MSHVQTAHRAISSVSKGNVHCAGFWEQSSLKSWCVASLMLDQDGEEEKEPRTKQGKGQSLQYNLLKWSSTRSLGRLCWEIIFQDRQWSGSLRYVCKLPWHHWDATLSCQGTQDACKGLLCALRNLVHSGRHFHGVSRQNCFFCTHQLLQSSSPFPVITYLMTLPTPLASSRAGS